MERYLEEFRDQLKEHEGSLVRVSSVRGRYAKQFLGALAREGAIERVAWGWYYVPARHRPASVLEFLAGDRNFKVVTGQTAASFWNGDFIHRDSVSVTVEDHSYKRALEAFVAKSGWSIEVEVDKEARRIPHKRFGPLAVEDRESAIVDCFQRWAFVDAIATLSPRAVERVKRDAYWNRIAGSDVRVGQAVEYAAHKLYGSGREVSISDAYVREELDEAIEKVMEFGAGD